MARGAGFMDASGIQDKCTKRQITTIGILTSSPVGFALIGDTIFSIYIRRI